MATWSEPKNCKRFMKLEKLDLINLIEFVVSNTYFQFGGDVYKQQIGIPMGTDCAPWIANLTLFSYEFVYMTNCLKANKFTVYKRLDKCFRYIDDITVVNDDLLFSQVYREIYPSSLTLKRVNELDTTADVLDINADIKEGKFVCKLFDKRKDFPFSCNVFPSISSNISGNCKYNIFFSQLYRYFTIISNISDLVCSVNSLINTLEAKGYVKERLYSTGRRFLNKNKLKFAHKFTNSDFDKFWTEVLGRVR